jgi:hypothetical protein
MGLAGIRPPRQERVLVLFVEPSPFQFWCLATWIADFYNVKRRHTVNDGLPTVTFERRMIEKRQASMALLRAAVA